MTWYCDEGHKSPDSRPYCNLCGQDAPSSDQEREASVRRNEATDIDRGFGSRVTDRALIRRIIQDLGSTSGKWSRALGDGSLATVSLLGTESWEDYVSLALAAARADLAVDLAGDVRELNERMADATALLTQQVELLERVVDHLEGEPADGDGRK